tara:strand:+ start:3005 stop:3256 length:252 start_codon:yes stop_codon:yes gene_type:complete
MSDFLSLKRSNTVEVEIWKPYENAIVSSLGRFKDTKGVVKTPRPNKEALGVCQSNISSCCRGDYKHTGGYEFRKVVEEAAAIY